MSRVRTFASGSISVTTPLRNVAHVLPLRVTLATKERAP